MNTSILLTVGSAVALSAYATFGTGLTPTDRIQLTQTMQHTVEHNKTGQSANWLNPDNGHLGTVTPMRTHNETESSPCRDYLVTATVSGETELAFGTACRESDGSWNIGSLRTRGQSERFYRRDGYGYRHYAYGYRRYGYPHYGFGHYNYTYGHYGYGRYY